MKLRMLSYICCRLSNLIFLMKKVKRGSGNSGKRKIQEAFRIKW